MFHHGCTVYIEIYYKPLCHVNYMEKMFNVLTFLQPLFHSIFFYFLKVSDVSSGRRDMIVERSYVDLDHRKKKYDMKLKGHFISSNKSNGFHLLFIIQICF